MYEQRDTFVPRKHHADYGYRGYNWGTSKTRNIHGVVYSCSRAELQNEIISVESVLCTSLKKMSKLSQNNIRLSKQHVLALSCFNAGPLPTTRLAQHQSNIGSTPCVSWHA